MRENSYEFWEVVKFFKKEMITSAVRPNDFEKKVTMLYRPGDEGVKQLCKLNGLGMELAMQGITQEDMDAEWKVEFTPMYQKHHRAILIYLNLELNELAHWSKRDFSLHDALNSSDKYELLSMVAFGEDLKPINVFFKGGED